MVVGEAVVMEECKTNFSEILEFVMEKHSTQMYGDKRYIYHLLDVAAKTTYLSENEYDDSYFVERATAYCHDVIEDTDANYEQVNSLCGSVVAEAVMAVTKVKGESYENYIKKVKSNGLALLIKKADTLCNLEESVKCGDAQRVNKYSKQIALLMGD